MLTDSARKEVLSRLAAAEKEHQMRILFAVESGSRAWGFASENSDYDVRFVYVRQSDWYLSVQPQRDVIEYPIVDDFDINGWDAAKALPLLRKCNPSLLEWLYSPLVYRCDGRFAPALREFINQSYSPLKGLHHYLSMAKSTYRSYLKRERVPFKKYFYTLRPLLAVRWIEQNLTLPPVAFDQLLPLLDDEPEVKAVVLELVAMKRSASEQAVIPAVTVLNEYLERELNVAVRRDFPEVEAMCWHDLNNVFRLAVNAA